MFYDPVGQWGLLEKLDIMKPETSSGGVKCPLAGCVACKDVTTGPDAYLSYVKPLTPAGCNILSCSRAPHDTYWFPWDCLK